MERERRAKELKRKLEEQLRPLCHKEEQVQRKLLPKSNRLKELCSPREAENTQRLLGMLPPEVWEKILLDHLENDLFPLALSCRYFRQVQKELVARARQSRSESGEPRLALKTNLKRKLDDEDQPASADYLRFCSKEKAPVETTLVSNDWNLIKANYIRQLAAFHGHLPLLQELHEPANKLGIQITAAAGEYTFHSLLFFFVLASDFILSFSSLQRTEANWRPCSG